MSGRARRGVHEARPVQLGLIAEGMLDDRTATAEDLLALWVLRVADLNAAIDVHEGARP